MLWSEGWDVGCEETDAASSKWYSDNLSRFKNTCQPKCNSIPLSSFCNEMSLFVIQDYTVDSHMMVVHSKELKCIHLPIEHVECGTKYVPADTYSLAKGQ